MLPDFLTEYYTVCKHKVFVNFLTTLYIINMNITTFRRIVFHICVESEERCVDLLVADFIEDGGG